MKPVTGSLAGLLTSAGQEALAEAASLAVPSRGFLPLYQELARRHPAPLARAAAEQALLRLKAAAKYPDAGRMYFEREALEQATAAPLAAWRAVRFRGCRLIFDLACGLGGDSLALAEAADVVAVDHDPGRLRLLRANARALGLDSRITTLCADLRSPAWRFPSGSAAFFDPARRAAGRRVHRIDRYQPSLTIIDEWSDALAALAVKVSPAVELPQLERFDCEVEFVAWRNELREAVLWFGDLKRGGRRATVLPGPHSLTSADEPDLESGSPLTYLYEPNPAVMRAGLVRTLGRMLDARLLDPTTAFLSSAACSATPFARGYRILDWYPFNLKDLRARLRREGVGRLTVKKRGSAVTPEELGRKLRLRGQGEATVVLTRLEGRPIVLRVEPLGARQDEDTETGPVDAGD